MSLSPAASGLRKNMMTTSNSSPHPSPNQTRNQEHMYGHNASPSDVSVPSPFKPVLSPHLFNPYAEGDDVEQETRNRKIRNNRLLGSSSPSRSKMDSDSEKKPSSSSPMSRLDTEATTTAKASPQSQAVGAANSEADFGIDFQLSRLEPLLADFFGATASGDDLSAKHLFNLALDCIPTEDRNLIEWGLKERVHIARGRFAHRKVRLSLSQVETFLTIIGSGLTPHNLEHRLLGDVARLGDTFLMQRLWTRYIYPPLYEFIDHGSGTTYTAQLPLGCHFPGGMALTVCVSKEGAAQGKGLMALRHLCCPWPAMAQTVVANYQEKVNAVKRHPTILPARMVFVTADIHNNVTGCGILSQFCTGGSLAHLLAQKDIWRRRQAQDAVWPLQVAVWMTDVADALHYLHETVKMAHGDVKNTNILFTATGRMMLGDVGMCQVMNALQRSHTQIAIEHRLRFDPEPTNGRCAYAPWEDARPTYPAPEMLEWLYADSDNDASESEMSELSSSCMSSDCESQSMAEGSFSHSHEHYDVDSEFPGPGGPGLGSRPSTRHSHSELSSRPQTSYSAATLLSRPTTGGLSACTDCSNNPHSNLNKEEIGSENDASVDADPADELRCKDVALGEFVDWSTRCTTAADIWAFGACIVETLLGEQETACLRQPLAASWRAREITRGEHIVSHVIARCGSIRYTEPIKALLEEMFIARRLCAPQAMAEGRATSSFTLSALNGCQHAIARASAGLPAVRGPSGVTSSSAIELQVADLIHDASCIQGGADDASVLSEIARSNTQDLLQTVTSPIRHLDGPIGSMGRRESSSPVRHMHSSPSPARDATTTRSGSITVTGTGSTQASRSGHHCGHHDASGASGGQTLPHDILDATLAGSVDRTTSEGKSTLTTPESSHETFDTLLPPALHSLLTQKDWRVRAMTANQLALGVPQLPVPSDHGNASAAASPSHDRHDDHEPRATDVPTTTSSSPSRTGRGRHAASGGSDGLGPQANAFRVASNHTQAVSVLLALLLDGAAEVRASAVASLGQFGCEALSLSSWSAGTGRAVTSTVTSTETTPHVLQGAVATATAAVTIKTVVDALIGRLDDVESVSGVVTQALQRLAESAITRSQDVGQSRNQSQNQSQSQSQNQSQSQSRADKPQLESQIEPQVVNEELKEIIDTMIDAAYTNDNAVRPALLSRLAKVIWSMPGPALSVAFQRLTRDLAKPRAVTVTESESNRGLRSPLSPGGGRQHGPRRRAGLMDGVSVGGGASSSLSVRGGQAQTSNEQSSEEAKEAARIAKVEEEKAQIAAAERALRRRCTAELFASVPNTSDGSTTGVLRSIPRLTRLAAAEALVDVVQSDHGDVMLQRAALRAIAAIPSDCNLASSWECIPPLIENETGALRADACAALASLFLAVSVSTSQVVDAVDPGIVDDTNDAQGTPADPSNGIYERVPRLLQQCLFDDDANVRGAAATALSKLGDDAADICPAVMSLLDDQEVLVRRAAAESIGYIAKGTTAAMAAATLDKIVSNATEDEIVRCNSIGALGRLQEARSARTLEVASRDYRVAIRAAAMKALALIGRFATSSMIACVLARLKDSDASVRANAIVAVGVMLTPANCLGGDATDLARATALKTLAAMQTAHQAVALVGQGIRQPPEVLDAISAAVRAMSPASTP